MANPSSPRVTRSALLEGAWFALEQCGRLLKDAGTLYSVGSYSSAVALAMFAREELGRHGILIEMWKRAAAGSPPTAEEIQKACDDHITKQREGQLSVTYRGRMDSQMGKASQQQMEHPPGSPEFTKAQEMWEAFKDRRLKETPSERHQTRMEALYVDINDDGQTWNRPCETEKDLAHGALEDAMNDYRNRRGNLLTPAVLEAIDADLNAAVQAWPDRPELPYLPHLSIDGDTVYR